MANPKNTNKKDELKTFFEVCGLSEQAILRAIEVRNAEQSKARAKMPVKRQDGRRKKPTEDPEG